MRNTSILLKIVSKTILYVVFDQHVKPQHIEFESIPYSIETGENPVF